MYNYDTLDYLIPPVKSRHKNITSDFLRKISKESDDDNDTLRLRTRSLSSKLAKRVREASLGLSADVRTSSSLVLKTITNKLLLEQFSILNQSQKKNPFRTKVKNQKIPKNNPVIKITVVPTSAETQTSKAFLKRKRIAKQIQETISNTDNCRQDNNICMIRNHQGIHDIRETSSANLFKPTNTKNTKHEKSVSHITYTKRILNSLNMERKSRKENLNWVNNGQVSPKGGRKNNTVGQGCTCDSTVNTVLNDMNSRKNRVTIVGRLGIDNNDQYILNCAATVNNKPIETQFRRKSVAAAPIEQFENNNGNIKLTKATQANFTTSLERDAVNNTTISNKTVQCNCNNVTDAATTFSRCEIDESIERKNPLIVISVYPTKDKMDDVKYLDDLIQIKRIESSKNTKPDARNNISKKPSNRQKMETTNVNTNTIKSLGSRSPSPARKVISKDKSDNKLINQKGHKTAKKESPNSKMSLNKLIPQKDKANRNSIIVNAAHTSKVDPFKICQERTNTDKRKIKKAIVDNYTRKFLSPVTGKDLIKKLGHKPRNDASKVTINIDGDTERYRVLFLQDKLNTDLSVQRLVKPQTKMPSDLKSKEYNYNSGDSVDNFLMLPKITKPRKQTMCNNKKHDKQLNNSEALDKKSSRLKIRDSLEINHWREGGNSPRKQSIQPANKIILKSKKADGDDNDIFVKHYRGDKCCVPNPAERDQQIRELLGIEHLREKITQDIFSEFIDQELRSDFYPKNRGESRTSVSHQYNYLVNDATDKKKIAEKPKLVTTSTQYDQSTVFSYQQMVLNRNIQVFLQVDQFTNQKPIMLSRKQYDKVKKTIQKKLSNKSNQERRKVYNSKKCSVISIGEVRKTRKQQISSEKTHKFVQAKHDLHHESVDKGVEKEKEPLVVLYSVEKDMKGEDNVKTFVKPSPRQVVSSTEVRYGSMAHMKHVTFSSSNLGSRAPESLLYSPRKKDCHSIHTIFKGHKKSPTPNLGTSAFSLYSDADNRSENKYTVYPHDEKPKKPFFRRLMSCLVMRTDKISEGILPSARRYEPSVMSSFDSYHISTSLAAIDITSSLYDTSASFYSNHTIYPVARMKRGFFSSVRGFLTNFKGR
ncbi:uncharacterized protein mRpL44 isoform X1 [Epargyreus clarus]|uniref:uncharacterized protein mRpL44 isoform X1 n=1 Tax=Epargyreus clarus TaxID=520877 RepID=UPI003C2E2727